MPQSSIPQRDTLLRLVILTPPGSGCISDQPLANRLNVEAQFVKILVIQNLPPVKDICWLHHVSVDPGVVEFLSALV